MTEQEKREKVIQGLKWCMNEEHDCYREKGCPYENEGEDVGCKYALHRDALELLKAQEPRVMTWEEAQATVNNGPFIIFEGRHSTGSELDFGVLADDLYEMSDGSLLTVCNFGLLKDDYGKRFRLWTSRPTEAEREAVKWE